MWIILVQLYETFRGFEICCFVLREKHTFGQHKIGSRQEVYFQSSVQLIK